MPACSRIWRLASARIVEEERQHVLELVAESEGAAALLGAGARPQTRGEHLIREPVVHQAVELGEIALDAKRAVALRPPAAGGGDPLLGGRKLGSDHRLRLFEARGLAEQDADQGGLAGRHLDLAREARDPDSVVGSARIGHAVLDEERIREIASAASHEARAHALAAGLLETGRGEREPGVEIVLGVAEEERAQLGRAPHLDLAEALARQLGEHHLEVGHHAAARWLRAPRFSMRSSRSSAGASGTTQISSSSVELAVLLAEARVAAPEARLVTAARAAAGRSAPRGPVSQRQRRRPPARASPPESCRA